MRLIDAESAMDGATLFDWYISSVGDGAPLWTEEHIDELLGDFLVIPINTPAIEAKPVTHGEWIPSEMNAENKENAEMLGIDIETFLSKAAYCSYCGMQQITNGRDKTRKALIHNAVYKYCPNCGAKMDGGKSDG